MDRVDVSIGPDIRSRQQRVAGRGIGELPLQSAVGIQRLYQVSGGIDCPIGTDADWSPTTRSRGSPQKITVRSQGIELRRVRRVYRAIGPHGDEPASKL